MSAALITATTLEVDTTTLVLGSAVAALLVAAIYTRAPPPQAHPFLLGRQSVTSRHRLPSESPVYTNATNGGMRAPIRPEKRIRTLKDILEGSVSRFEGGERGTWIKGGEKVAEVVEALRAGLLSTLGSEGGTVAVLVEDATDALLVTLALILTPHTPLVIAPGSNIPASAPVTAIIQSSTRFSAAQQLSATPDAKWISLGGAGEKSTVAEDLLATGRTLVANGQALAVVESQPTDIALTVVSEGVPLSFTHLNLTAALVSWLSLFPVSPTPSRPSHKDTLLSFHHPSTPTGFGLALFALYTQTSLYLPSLPHNATHEDLSIVLLSPSCPPPTLIFAPSAILDQPLYSFLLQTMLGDSSFIIKHARNGKLRLLREGVVTRSTWWDSILFDGMRKDVHLHALRSLIFDGPVLQSRLDFFRIALGVPTISSQGHAFLLAPLSAAMMWDFQRLPPPGMEENEGVQEKGSVGPPVSGVELKLRGDEAEIAAGRVKGEVLIRSPLLPAPVFLPPSLLLSDNDLPQLPLSPGASVSDDCSATWLRTGLKAEMSKEGVLWLV